MDPTLGATSAMDLTPKSKKILRRRKRVEIKKIM
jgi:hypothetical protein